jgi:adenosylcobinamide kinase / adenosylcobinamide-phosphate guanylyltransferase
VTSTFFIGGARSGKSTLAVERAHHADSLGLAITFVVTGEALDDEMMDRIRRHQDERPSTWLVHEAPRDLAGAMRALADDHFVVVDCVSFWVANLIMDGVSAEHIRQQAEALCAAIMRRTTDTVVVSNEVGLGLVPDNELGRTFRDTLGRVNAQLCRATDEAYLVVAGRTLRLT